MGRRPTSIALARGSYPAGTSARVRSMDSGHGIGRIEALRRVATVARRNELCPCRSGKRFKHCHGKIMDAAPVPREIADCVRFVCFETHLEDFRLATNGGTAFIVRYKGTHFAITCKHVLKGFEIEDWVITDARLGKKVAAIQGAAFPTNLKGDIDGSDLDDICVINLEEGDGEFFNGAYDLDRFAARTSEPAHRLVATGFIKEKSSIEPPNLFTALFYLNFTDAGRHRTDDALRRGLATYLNPGITSIVGMSGAPIYDLNVGALCGMVARGTLQDDGRCMIHYIDIFDILHFLDAVSVRAQKADYIKPRSML